MNSDAGGAPYGCNGFRLRSLRRKSPRYIAAARRVVDEREKTVDRWGNPA